MTQLYSLAGTASEFPADGDYWIAPDAVLIGNVRLRREASIWFGAVLRADDDIIEIGERARGNIDRVRAIGLCGGHRL